MKLLISVGRLWHPQLEMLPDRLPDKVGCRGYETRDFSIRIFYGTSLLLPGHYFPLIRDFPGLKPLMKCSLIKY